VLFLLAASFHFHSYWRVNDAKMKQTDQINFMKNMALVGALLMLMAIPQPWPSFPLAKNRAESRAPDEDSPKSLREEKQEAAQQNSRYVTCPVIWSKDNEAFSGRNGSHFVHQTGYRY